MLKLLLGSSGEPSKTSFETGALCVAPHPEVRTFRQTKYHKVFGRQAEGPHRGWLARASQILSP